MRNPFTGEKHASFAHYAVPTAIGGAVGAGTGALIDDRNRTRGAILGGLAGGAFGYGVGDDLNRAAVQAAAEQDELVEAFIKRKLDKRINMAPPIPGFVPGKGIPPPDPTKLAAVRETFRKYAAELSSDAAKFAASRLDKEVALGNVGYHDVMPNMPPALGNTGYGKWLARGHLNDIARDQSPADKARVEALDASAFRNDHLRADKMRRAETFDRERKGVRGMFDDSGLGDTPLQGPTLSDAPHLQHWKKNYEGELLPEFHAIGPATEPRPGSVPRMFVPEASGQFMRAANEAKGKEDFAALGKAVGHPTAGIAGDASLLPARKGVDATINRGILQHEKGEARAMGKAVHYPHASHLDVTPLLEEDMLYARNPEAYDLANQLRNKKRNADDKLLWKLKKQVGYHPNAPLPIEGKQTEALRGLLAKNQDKLNPKKRMENLFRQGMNDYRYQSELRGMKQIQEAGGNVARAAPVRTVAKTLPQPVLDRLDSAMPRAMGNFDALRAAKSPLDKLKAVGQGLKTTGPDLLHILRGMKV